MTITELFKKFREFIRYYLIPRKIFPSVVNQTRSFVDLFDGYNKNLEAFLLCMRKRDIRNTKTTLKVDMFHD